MLHLLYSWPGDLQFMISSHANLVSRSHAMPFHRVGTPAHVLQDWRFADNGTVVLPGGIPLEEYTTVMAGLQPYVNLEPEAWRLRCSFSYEPGFEMFQWLIVDLAGMFEFTNHAGPCSKGPRIFQNVPDPSVGVTCYHGTKFPEHVLYSRCFEPARNVRGSAHGLFHGPALNRTTVQYARPVNYGGTMSWRCVFEIQACAAPAYVKALGEVGRGGALIFHVFCIFVRRFVPTAVEEPIGIIRRRSVSAICAPRGC